MTRHLYVSFFIRISNVGYLLDPGTQHQVRSSPPELPSHGVNRSQTGDVRCVRRCPGRGGLSVTSGRPPGPEERKTAVGKGVGREGAHSRPCAQQSYPRVFCPHKTPRPRQAAVTPRNGGGHCGCPDGSEGPAVTQCTPRRRLHKITCCLRLSYIVDPRYCSFFCTWS